MINTYGQNLFPPVYYLIAPIDNTLLIDMENPKSFYFIPRTLLNETKDDVSVAESSRAGSLQTGILPEAESTSSSWFSGLFRPRGYEPIDRVKMRKVPTKIEPKVFFANERTFLAWLHMAVTLSSISIAIVAFAEANKFSQIYGLMLMPVAITFCAYSLYMYMKRAHMIKNRHPGPCK